jgi:predicted nuclease of restriction endonuclease-like (RecB) superfamily
MAPDGATMTDKLAPPSEALVEELRALIEATRGRVAQTVNSELVALYWQVGKRLREEIIGDQRAAYGEEVVAQVAKALTAEFGRGFSKRNLHHMVRLVEVFPEAGIVHALRSQLSWTHLRELIAIDDPLKREFYTELCRIERWSTRTLKRKMDGMLFERTAVAKRPAAVVEGTLEALRDEDRMSPDLVFRDPYVLDFLGLPADFNEAELEAAILRELEAFLLELGQGFSFIARQKRMSIGADDYYLDLLFFHRPLRALVAIELKLGRFNARDKGQMELYLRWLDRHERRSRARSRVREKTCFSGGFDECGFSSYIAMDRASCLGPRKGRPKKAQRALPRAPYHKPFVLAGVSLKIASIFVAGSRLFGRLLVGPESGLKGPRLPSREARDGPSLPSTLAQASLDERTSLRAARR